MRGGRNKFGPMYKRDRARKLQMMRQRQLALQTIRGTLGDPANYPATVTPFLHIKQEIQIPQVSSLTSSPDSSPSPAAVAAGLVTTQAGSVSGVSILPGDFPTLCVKATASVKKQTYVCRERRIIKSPSTKESILDKLILFSNKWSVSVLRYHFFRVTTGIICLAHIANHRIIEVYKLPKAIILKYTIVKK